MKASLVFPTIHYLSSPKHIHICIYFFLFWYFRFTLFYMYWCFAWTYVSALHMCPGSVEARRRHWISRNGSFRLLWITWVEVPFWSCVFHLTQTNVRGTQEQPLIPFKMVSFSLCFLQRFFLPSQSLSSLCSSGVSLAKILLQFSLDIQIFTCTYMWSFKHFHYKNCLHRRHMHLGFRARWSDCDASSCNPG